MSEDFMRKLEELCEGATSNSCRDYGRDVKDWCGVCLLVHDIRKLIASLLDGVDTKHVADILPPVDPDDEAIVDRLVASKTGKATPMRGR